MKGSYVFVQSNIDTSAECQVEFNAFYYTVVLISVNAATYGAATLLPPRTYFGGYAQGHVPFRQRPLPLRQMAGQRAASRHKPFKRQLFNA
ncbi:hypothetical protein NPIL_692391 [Nephila pilipes]|uniref:Uncharacterized protein n=1 Tax=Nephila pilipes TaxID=299642 RepID=A0A8X6TL65_NEPPI|nr:hypothetical protein NPIL_692391 [Nephila pilipes]